ncbi:thermonuclease family protein [Blastomonas sp. AAP53]|uniref:thermonuclease family protein n=1 Tax=Blastomonas sp. AAP53 TaxID=1248760 RepID=UPI0002F66D82|nr:thermonuclease family protein [Blastomonas sp. AAP53]
MPAHALARARRHDNWRLTGLAIALAALVGWNLPDWIGPDASAPTALYGVMTSRTAAASGDSIATHFPICSSGLRYTCVIDGDTFWLRGQKIRVADIDTPEVSSPRCAAELQLGRRATDRMQQLLNAGPFALEPADRAEDRYGRKLFRVTRGGESLGNALVGEGLAVWYGNGRPDWC